MRGLRPVPVDTPLMLKRRGETLLVHDGDDLVAEIEPASLELSVIDPVSIEEAREASDNYIWRDHHPAARAARAVPPLAGALDAELPVGVRQHCEREAAHLPFRADVEG